MNRNVITALVLAAAASGSAFADDITIDNTPFQSTRTTAEVKAELQAYRQAGVNPWSIAYNPLKEFRSGQTRAQVTAAYIASRDEVAALTSEDSGSAYFAQGHGTPASTTLAGQPRAAQ